MGKQKQLLSLQPFSSSDIGINTTEVPGTDPATLQLATDMINVVEGRVPLESFPIEYQEKIKSFYRFSATRYTSDKPIIAKRIRETLDII
jgi:hypothetical protein